MSTDPTGAITNRVITAIRDTLYLPTAMIGGSTELLGDLDVDSLDLVEAFIDLEEDFGVEFPADAAERFRTVGNVVAFLRGDAAAE
jgi:acyl carrier protein